MSFQGSRAAAWLRVVAALAVLSGCYSYQVVPLETVSVGESVRARVSAEESERLREVLGRDQRTIEGQLLEKSADGVLIAVSTAAVADGTRMAGIHQRIAVPHLDVQEFEIRRVDRWKTAGVVALASAAVTAVALAQFNAERPGTGPGKGGTNNSILSALGFAFKLPMWVGKGPP